MLEGFNQDVSTFSTDIDRAFWITTGISLGIFLLITGLMVYFIFRYHHSKVKPTEIRNIKNHLGLEITWTVIPTILFFIIFYYGYSAFRQIRTMPKDAFTVDVLGKRWSWTFTYPNGKRTGELYVPQGENIKLRLHVPNNDVLHSFYVPAFRVKEDLVPGQENHLWFNATIPGRYDIQCAEYCGTRHSYMLSKVEVMEKKAFDTWYNSDKLTPHDTDTPGEGETLYKTLGCASCHSLDGSTIVGPSFKGIYGKKITVITGGKTRTLVVDEAYLRDSIQSPEKDVVENFPKGIMPNLSDQINEKQMNAIIAFIKAQSSIENNASAQPSVAPPPITETQENRLDGETLFSSKGCIGCHSLDGSKRVGPSLKGIYQSKQKVVTEGQLHEVTVDTAYLHNSIQHPNADVVEGFPSGVMPPFGTTLSDEEVNALVKYLEGV
jgi:cytochrome c oxidase subunit 2